MPISFSDGALQRFSLEASDGQSVTRVQLQNDAALRERYYAWWFRKRKDFLTALTAHLRANVHPDAVLLFTPDASEPGRSLSGGMQIVTDDVPVWTRLLSQPQPNNRKPSITAYNAVVTADSHFRALTSPTPTWGNWEWQHSDPQADPQNYAGADGPLLTYSFNRAYTVSSPKAFDAFRTQAGLAAIRHYPLNENAMDSSLGYFVADVERAGPYSMLPEARAMAYGDPRFIGYLAASSFNRGFPEYARAFYAAFLSLPALPSAMLPNAASDSEVVVRAIRTKAHGTYLAIVHVGLSEKRGVTVTLPTKGKVVDAATGKPLDVRNGKMRLSLYPCELKAVHIR